MSNPVSLSFTFLPIFAPLLQLATCPAFSFTCFLFQVLEMKVTLLTEFKRKLISVNPGKERLRGPLLGERGRFTGGGGEVMGEDLLLYAASFHVLLF